MKQPNCFIVGAAKASTTTIFNYLAKHGGVFVPAIKEPNFFCSDIHFNTFRKNVKRDTVRNIVPKDNIALHKAWIDDKTTYRALYKGSEIYKVALDGSVSYLFSKDAANNIYEHNARSKIIMILRNPIDRAFSHYLMNLQIGYAYKPFISEITEDYKKETKGWGKSHLYIECGLYYEQVKRYKHIFPKEQVLILLYDDIKRDLLDSLNRITDFLDIDRIKKIGRQKYNVSKVPQNPSIYMLLKRIYKALNTNRVNNLKLLVKMKILSENNQPQLREKEKQMLMPYFEKDIKKLSNLLSHDLSKWLL